MSLPEKKNFKDWFDQDAAKQLAVQIHTVYPDFDQKAFIKNATRELRALEMNGRVAQFAGALADGLPDDKNRALEILTLSLPEIHPDSEQITNGWLQWPLGKFIADYGLPHFETSMTAMIELTRRFTSEFAVRPFIEHRQEETIARLVQLCGHPSPHVRRWCSEGTRPLLPWGKKLIALVKDPSPVWPILDTLIDDPDRYVQKSVANHLNDISKNHPDPVLEKCSEWMKQASVNRKWIIRHALRTLIKDGHPDALRLIGYPPVKNLKCQLRVEPRKIRIGENTLLKLRVTNRAPGTRNLLIDYAVTYVRQKGKTGRKVFKWTTRNLQAGESISLEKKHNMKITSVRALYPGTHKVEILVNGKARATKVFELIENESSVPGK